MAISLGILTQHFQTNPNGDKKDLMSVTGRALSNRLKKWEAEKRCALKTCCHVALQKPNSMLQWVQWVSKISGIFKLKFYHEMTTALWHPANFASKTELLARLPLRRDVLEQDTRTLRQNLSQVLVPNPPIRPRQVHVRIPGHCKS